MTYGKGHKNWMCDKCEIRQKKWKVPFIYNDCNDESHKDEGRNYRQYFVCDICKDRIDRIMKKKGENSIWEMINNETKT